MDCEKIHMYLLNEENKVQCPFCDEILYLVKSIETKYRELPNITNNSKIVCVNCGTMFGYKTVNEFVDFYENMNRIRKKIYLRKYHILNVIDDITRKNKIQISYNDREKALKIFTLIDQASSQVDCDRKRMVSIKYI